MKRKQSSNDNNYKNSKLHQYQMKARRYYFEKSIHHWVEIHITLEFEKMNKREVNPYNELQMHLKFLS